MAAATAYAALADLREEAGQCRELWVAVVGRVLLDADRRDADGEAARRWLQRPDQLALELAGLNPDAARPGLARIAASGRAIGKLHPTHPRLDQGRADV